MRRGSAIRLVTTVRNASRWQMFEIQIARKAGG